MKSKEVFWTEYQIIKYFSVFEKKQKIKMIKSCCIFEINYADLNLNKIILKTRWHLFIYINGLYIILYINLINLYIKGTSTDILKAVYRKELFMR